MIYFGVQLFQHAFHIACVSESFVLLEHLHLKFNRNHKLDPWINSLTKMTEKSCWFFDEFEFNMFKSMAYFFENYDYCNNIYLVNHPKIIDMTNFLFDWEMFNFKNHHRKNNKNLEVPFLLALSLKIFHEDDIKSYDSIENLPF